MYDAISNGLGFCVGDHAHPAQGLIEPLYERIAEMYARLMRCEEYTKDAQYLAEIGIISVAPAYDMWEHMGLCRMLSELKYGYNVIRENANFEEYKLLVLPQGTLISETTAKKLEQFMQGGGGNYKLWQWRIELN